MAIFSSVEEVVRSNGASTSDRARLKKTALSPVASFPVRYAALRRLEATAPARETLAVASELTALSGASAEERWLVENSIAVVSRVRLPEAELALAQLASSDVFFKRGAALAVAPSGEGR